MHKYFLQLHVHSLEGSGVILKYISFIFYILEETSCLTKNEKDEKENQ